MKVNNFNTHIAQASMPVQIPNVIQQELGFLNPEFYKSQKFVLAKTSHTGKDACAT